MIIARVLFYCAHISPDPPDPQISKTSHIPQDIPDILDPSGVLKGTHMTKYNLLYVYGHICGSLYTSYGIAVSEYPTFLCALPFP